MPGQIEKCLHTLVGGTTLRMMFFLAVSIGQAQAMNDTNAIVSRGLFPLAPVAARELLAIRAESVVVTITRTGFVERRAYVVVNRGPAATVDLATIGEYNVAAPDTVDEDIRVELDRRDLRLRPKIGLLINRGGWVEATSPLSETIERCLETNDGTVCSQDWISFPVEFRTGQERKIVLTFTTRCGPRAALEAAIGRLRFYSEQFWEKASVATAVVQLHVGATGVPATRFNPSGPYLKYSKRPSRISAEVLTWTFRNHRQTEFYGESLVHPFAVDNMAILDQYLRWIGQSSKFGGLAAIVKADTLLTLASESARISGGPKATLIYRLLEPARVEIGIWDSRGHVVRRLGSLGHGVGTHSVEWQGTDDRDRPVAPGIYRFLLEVRGEWIGDREIAVIR